MNITINIQGGTGNTMYTGPVQRNTYNNHVPLRALSLPLYHCLKCGKSSTNSNEFFCDGECWDCIDREREERERRNQDRWLIESSVPDELPEPYEPLQIAAPEQQQKGFDLQAHLAELEERYAANYQRMIDNGIKYHEGEARYFADFTAKHARRDV